MLASDPVGGGSWLTELHCFICNLALDLNLSVLVLRRSRL